MSFKETEETLYPGMRGDAEWIAISGAREPVEPCFLDDPGWQTAALRVDKYLMAAGVPGRERRDIVREAIARASRGLSSASGDNPGDRALEELHAVLAERYQQAPEGETIASVLQGSAAWRAWMGAHGLASRSAPGDRRDLYRLSVPPIRRVRMIPERAHGAAARARPREHDHSRRRSRDNTVSRKHEKSKLSERGRPSAWPVAARWRRRLLLALVTIQTVIAASYMARVLPYQGVGGLEPAIIGLFAVLFSWISFGFWTAIMGFLVLLKNSRRFAIAEITKSSGHSRPLAGRTAIVVPICNEDVKRVFAGLEATYRSLEDTGERRHFDFFVLSDTTEPEIWAEEELAWARTCSALGGFERIYYRRRRNNIKRKSGNIADFCRRWGSRYDYMVVFDADSVMAGETLVRLAKIMDRYPKAGIIQTVPMTVNRESLYARIQQFASRVYGPMLAAGLHFWQLGESYYWGHNAIIRVAPFIKHCALSRLSGKPPLGGEILSHDFVEAALMGRAGWEVWLAYDMGGSYEETPPTLGDELKRDRRWCQGNLQHARLLTTRGLRPAHRAVFFTGIMAYASSLLWLSLLLLSTGEIALQSLIPPVYFSSKPSLFPIWPQWHPDLALALLSTTAGLLFLPKVLAFVLIVRGGQKRRFGGAGALAASVILEIVASALFAPIRMWFHSKFVLLTLLGRQIKWDIQRRDDAEMRWRESLRHHGVSTALAFLWISGLYWLNASFLWWVAPIAASLVASVPLTVLSSRVSLGRSARRWKLFLTPEELEPPKELRRLKGRLAEPKESAGGGAAAERSVFMRAIIDPYANALHISLLRARSPRTSKMRALRDKIARQGIGLLTSSEKARLLRDAESLHALHLKAWQARERSFLPDDPRPA